MALSYSDILNNASKIVSGNKGSATSKNTKQTYANIKSNVGKYVAATQPVGRPSAYEQGVINDLTSRLGDYDWQSAYTYDIWDEEDAKRKEQGKMPLYQYNRYDLTDPVDKYLYDNGLPPKKDLEGFVEKAEKEAEDKAEETKFAEWREQAEQAKSGYAEPIITKSEDGSITFTETGKHTEASEGNGWFGAFTNGMKNAKFDNSGVQSRWDRMIWEMQNMQAPTTKELQPYVDALVAGGEYKNEKEATEAAKDQYRKEQEQKWLEYVGAPKDAEGNFLYGSKYAYEGRVVADEMTRAAQESEDFKTMDQLNAEHADDLNYGWDDIYKSTEATSRSSAPIYDHMTDEQKAAYFYYKERGYGDEYLVALTPELTEKAAAATKEYWTEEFPIVGDAALAITGGLESGIKGLIRLVKDDYAARTEGVSSQAAQENRQELAQSDDFWSKAAGLGLDILYSTGNMAPSMLVGAVNPLAGAVAIGASSAGNARVEARNEGATEEQAVLYGLMSGTAEAVMQYLLGGIGKLGGVVTKKSFSKTLTGALSKVLKNPKVVNAFAQHISGALSEALEEYVTGLIDPILRNIALNENNVLNLLDGDALYGALLGAFTGGLLGGDGGVATGTGAAINTQPTTNTHAVEPAAQAQIEAPVEQTYKPEPVDTRILAGDTVILDDGSQVVVQDVEFDPINNMEMYLVDHNGKPEIVNELHVTAQTIPETADTSNLKLGVNNQSHTTFDKTQQRQLDVLDSLAKKGGVPVAVVDRIDVGRQRAAANGSYDPKTGTIFVAADAIEGAYLYTGMHELTHHIKNFNAQGYTALENLVVDYLKKSKTYGDAGLEGRINELVSEGFSRETALEEIVADSIPAVLTDKSTVEKLVRQNRPVAERVRDFLYEFWRSIKTTMDKLSGVHGRKEIAALRENEKNIRKLYSEFDKALKAAGKSQATAVGGEMYSPKRPYSRNTPSDSIDNYTSETYNKYGWAYVNHVLNAEESADFFNKLSDIKNGVEANRTFDGKYIISVGAENGVNNVLVFTDGNYKNPSVDRVIRINLHDETSIEIVREDIYEIERTGRTENEVIENLFAPGVVSAYSEDVFPNYRQLRTGNGSRNPGSSGSEIDTDHRIQQDRGRNVGEAGQPVKTSTKSRTYNEALAEYGAIPKGANPARDVDVPQRMDDTTKVRQHVRTIMETGDVTEEMVDMLKDKIEQGDFSYTPQSNKEVLEKVDRDIERSYASAYREWDRTATGQLKPTAERIAKGERLLQIAAKNNDAETVLELSSQLAMMATESGKNLQIFSALKKLGPIGEVYYLEKAARKLSDDMSKRAKARYGEVKLSPGLVEEFVNAKTKAERDAAHNALTRDIASQVPATWKDKINAWRYMAMLTNPKTHIRNVLGNALFAPVVKMKNIIGTGMERAFLRGESTGKRTKSLGAKKEYKDFASQDFENVEKTLKSSGKYNISNDIENQRTIFGNKYKIAKPLEAVRKFNSNLLEGEDAVFLKHHYNAALAQYLQAKNADLSQYTEGSKQLEDARAYAMQEAWKATYRDASALTSWLSQGVHTKSKWFNTVADTLIEGTLPFKKTPVNVMRRGIEYSPLGLVKTISADLVRLKKGSIDAPTFIDNLASGLTGSGLFAVGMFLAAQGWATGGMDKKDPEDRMKLLTGEQAYAIQIGDFSYTVDWLAPMSIPFFLGVELWGAITEDKEITFATVMDSAKLALEPLFELSMLQGVNSLLETAGYDDVPITGIFGKMAQNYANQYIPSLVGAIARIVDPVTRKSYVDKTEGIPTDISSFYQQAIGKIPGLSSLRQPALNAWGEEEVTDDILMRMFENLVSPGYYSKIEVSPVEEELIRLFKVDGNTGVLPSEAEKYFQVDGERYDLTGAEYTTYATFRGETAYGLADALTSNVVYKDLLTDEIRAKCIEKAFEYANQIAKQTIVPEYDTDKWVGEMSKLKTPAEMADYIIDAVISNNKGYESEMRGIGDDVYDDASDFYKYLEEEYEGREYSDFRKKQWLGYVNSIEGLTTEQRKWLYESKGNYSWNKRND